MTRKEYINDLKNLCIDGLLADGAHHKQWYLEQILIRTGFDLETIRAGYDFDDGIAP